MSTRAQTGVAPDREPCGSPGLPSHAVSLNGSEWAAWRWAILRGAGFPADLVLTLAAPRLASQADGLIEAQDHGRAAQRAAFGAATRLVKEAADRRLLLKARKQLLKRKPVDSSAFAEPAARAAVDAYTACRARTNELREAFRQAYAAAEHDLDRAIADVCASVEFQEAVIWQNRRAYHGAIDPLLRDSGGSNSRYRKRRYLVARYIQRYCTKNDTIGFFGPVGWMRLSQDAAGLIARPGESLLAFRSVFFEMWCIDTLCETLSRNHSLLRWMAPRPACVPLQGTRPGVRCAAGEGPLELAPAQMIVFQACDGERTAAAIATDLAITHPALFPSGTAVYEHLAALRDMQVIAWAIECPPSMRPEQHLRRQLEGVGDERLRAESLAFLTELERARTAVSAAAGDPDALDRALHHIEQTFTRVTGGTPTRRAGQTYAGRTIVFEDCRRDVDVEIGADVLEELGRPLSLILRSARWLSAEVAARYQEVFTAVHGRLARESGSAAVDLSTFLRELVPPLTGKANAVLMDAVGAFRQRWLDVLAPLMVGQVHAPGRAADQRGVWCRSEDIREQVENAFPLRPPGWDRARHHSPDVMIAAAGPDAIRRGDYYFVLGELHIAKNTLDSMTFLEQHSSVHEVVQAMADDLCQPRVIFPPARGRGRVLSDLPTDYWVESTARAPCPRPRALPLASLIVARENDALVVRTRDGRLTFPILDFFGGELSMVVVNAFKKVLGLSSHSPRFTIDRLVVYRERWCIAAQDIGWPAEKDEAVRFVAARRWARETGLPRFVFVKSAVERKPFYVDFDSPIYVSLLAQMIRHTGERRPEASQVSITEMLPSHGRLWLPDRQGRRYASELRIAVCDRAAPGVETPARNATDRRDPCAGATIEPDACA